MSLSNINPDLARRALSVEDYYAQRLLSATAAWYNPALTTMRANDVTLRPDTIYLGEQGGVPTWEHAAFDVGRYRQASELYRQGKIDDDRLRFSPWLMPELEEQAKYQNDVYKYGRQAMSQYRSASGVVTVGDSSAINVIQILGEVLGTAQRNYSLEQAVTTVATPNLSLSVDTWQGFAASQDVGEGVEALVKKGRITRTEYLLKKDVGHIMVTDEAQLRADRDLFSTHVNHAVQDLRRLKNTKIATELEAATDVAAGDWAAFTGEHNTRDPVEDIGGIADTIELNGGAANTIASHGRPLRDFNTNSHIVGSQAPAQTTNFGARTQGGIAGLPGFTWYIDNLLTNTMVTVYDKSAVLLMQGPVRTAQYRIEPRGLDAYITRDYNLCRVIDSTLIRNLTGVSA